MNDKTLQDAYDQAGHNNARLVLRVAAVIYALIALAHAYLLPPVSRTIMVSVAGSTSILFVGLATWIARRQATAVSRHVLGSAALISVVNVLLHLWLEPAPHQSTNVVLLLLFFGAFMFDLLWYLVPTLAAVVGWVLIARPWDFPEPLNFHYTYSVLVSLSASALIYSARRTMFVHNVELQRNSDLQVRELERALTEVQREQRTIAQLSAILTDMAVTIDSQGAVVAYRVPDETDFLARQIRDRPASWAQLSQRLTELGAAATRVDKIGVLIGGAQDANLSGAVEVWLQQTGGPRHIYEARVVPLAQQQALLVLRDISEMILAQEALIREDAARLKALDLEREVTHRRKAEDELAESLALIRATLETTVDGLLVVDMFGNVRQYNGRFRAQWGLPDDLEIWRLQSVVHTVLRKELAQSPELVQAIFHPDALQSAETFHTIKTADNRDFELYSRVQELAGRKLGRVWTFREVTERTRTLQALRQSESNLHALFASSIQAFALLDGQGHILTFNPTASEYGYKYLNVSLQNGQNLLKLARLSELETGFREALEGAIVVREVHAGAHDFDFTMVPVYDADTVVGVSLSVVNTDDRVAALAALRSSEESLRLAVEAGGLILWFYELSSGRLVWQAGRPGVLVDLLGEMADAPARGMDAVYDDDVPEVTRALDAIAQHKQGIDLEFRVRLPDRLAWVHVRGEPIVDGRGDILRLIGIAEDVTDRREFQQRLEQARDRAEEANRLKNSILTNMSHEIRTPMTSILGFSEILARRLEDPALRQGALTIQRGGKRLLFLLDNLIDLAKLEVNRLDLRPTQHPVRESLRAVAALYAEQVAQKGIALTVDDSAEFAVYSDPRREQQILAAVLDNAVRFTARGSIEVGITHSELQGEQCVRISVRDTGVGISAEFLPHIFEDFRQESEGLSRSHEGSGLGLALAKRLLEQMGGRIAITSVKGEGTTVYIDVPQVHHPAGFSADQSLRAGARAQRSGVLLIGDSGFRLAARDALEAAHSGVHIAEVSDLRDTHAILASSAVASVLVQLDGTDPELGRRTVAALQQMLPLRGAQTVAVVRAATQATLEQIRNSGFDLVLASPLGLVAARRIAI